MIPLCSPACRRREHDWNSIIIVTDAPESFAKKAAAADAASTKRPTVEGDTSLNANEFIFLGVPRHYVRRSLSCWYKAYSRV
jgi:hypothetical protein